MPCQHLLDIDEISAKDGEDISDERQDGQTQGHAAREHTDKVSCNGNTALRWRHNGRHGISNPPASRLFTQPFIQTQIKETSKLRVNGLCAGNSPGIGFPAQMASNAENVSIWWRHQFLMKV